MERNTAACFQSPNAAVFFQNAHAASSFQSSNTASSFQSSNTAASSALPSSRSHSRAGEHRHVEIIRFGFGIGEDGNAESDV